MADRSLKDKIFTDTVEDLIRKISPLLHGHSSPVQGAVLGQLIAIWLGGHYTKDPDEQEALWESLLGYQTEMIGRLVKLERQRRQAG